MRLPSRSDHRSGRLLAVLAGLGIGVIGLAGGAAPAGASGAGLNVVVTGHGGAFSTVLEITCESPAPAASDGVELGTALTATRRSVAVAADGTSSFLIADLTDGTACSVTATGPTAAQLGAVDGGTPLVGPDGRLRGVAVTVDRGTTATADLTFQIPVAIASAVPRTERTTTTATGSGSAASIPPPLPASDGAASAATPVALAAARSTTTASSAALPDTSGSGTTVVLASLGVLACGAAAYALLLADARRRRRLR